jgi:hypothetical protein
MMNDDDLVKILRTVTQFCRRAGGRVTEFHQRTQRVNFPTVRCATM